MTRLCILLLTIWLLGVAPPGKPSSALAQAPNKTARIGVLLQVPASAPAVKPLWDALVEGLRERGWEQGRNLVLEGRFAGQNPERFHELVAELVTLKVDVIVAANHQAIDAARRQTSTIPIVMAGIADPVASGFVASLARPGGNITGLSNQLDEVRVKHLELLKELDPGLERIEIVYSQRYSASTQAMLAQRDEVAPQLGLTALSFAVNEPADIEKLFAAIVRERLQALIVHPAPIVSAHRKEIANAALEQRLPTITGLKVLVPDGFLMSYAHDPVASFRRAAWYIDRILAGADPGELPVERTHDVELVINLKTARAIGIQIPPFMLSRADEVIK